MLDTRLVFEEILQVGGTVAVKPTGSSMYPVIVTGDKLRISPPDKLKIGDIILYKCGDLMVCHRLVRISGEAGRMRYQTRGDTLLYPDRPVAPEEVLGKVARIERGYCSPARQVLLLLNPLLRVGRLNARVLTILVNIRQSVGRRARRRSNQSQ